ncbi:MAG: lytic transglycosylase domain-containing protein [Candidatus Binataceae bacterium]|jgi:membrane-bound lytic murein transglycosylase D
MREETLRRILVAIGKGVKYGLFTLATLIISLGSLSALSFAGSETITNSNFPADADRLQPVPSPSAAMISPAGNSMGGVPIVTSSQGEFERPAALEPNIRFWVDVFTAYGERDFVIHDKDNVWKIYEVQHLPGFGAPGRDEVADTTDFLRQKYTNILGRLGAGLPPADDDERRVAALFKGEPISAYTLAASNLRVQQGLREQYEEGLLRSRYYRTEMERIFADEGLPPSLVSLANIESGFYTTAKSSAGAVGIWQFTRDTGKEYMHITRYHDDRFDPVAETRAAAQLLRYNYDTLGSWPLAITAYNYGTGGMAQAAELYGGDFDRIFRSYSGPRFGFASRNYYAEFLAAVQVHEYEDQYFPNLKYEETPLPQTVRTDFAPPHRRASLHRVAHRGRHNGHRRHLVAELPAPPRAHLVMVSATRHSVRHQHHAHVQAVHAVRHHSHRHAIMAAGAPGQADT